ncbi:BN159_2729 family protein [Streptomyces sp. MNU89]|uniref:BN159_2729 family protein n=1 Tax=Streptomyces sp. MNU89 TaxID=2560025 RepID=UPI001E36C805|nr:BN159_2729 family protein [Streptomyces sp. MNU89]MCC9737730.1 BN159_2729 family protein [Streptomyces sp. MNU89]
MTLNPNLPHALRIIRKALAAYSGPELELRIAVDLDAAGLLTDINAMGRVDRTEVTPEAVPGPPGADRPPPDTVLPHQGIVLRRTDPAADPPPEPGTVTRLPAPAEWEARCARAEKVFEDLVDHHGDRPEVLTIEQDHDRVVVCIRARTLADWERWLSEIGAGAAEDTRPAGYAQLAFGTRAGVPVRLVAHKVPGLLHAAYQEAVRPYCLWGRVYDLARPLAENGGDGNQWLFLGIRDKSGMPLLSVRGRTELCTLENIVRHAGPLTPVDTGASPPVTGGDAD